MSASTQFIRKLSTAIDVVETGDVPRNGSMSLIGAFGIIVTSGVTVKSFHKDVAQAAYKNGMLAEYSTSVERYPALQHLDTDPVVVTCDCCKATITGKVYGFGPGQRGNEPDFCGRCVGVSVSQFFAPPAAPKQPLFQQPPFPQQPSFTLRPPFGSDTLESTQYAARAAALERQSCQVGGCMLANGSVLQQDSRSNGSFSVSNLAAELGANLATELRGITIVPSGAPAPGDGLDEIM